MSETFINCPMCGHRYDPAAHLSCQACPLHHGCQMVCCPTCGYQTVDAGQSVLARIADRLLFSRNQEAQKGGLNTDDIIRP